MVWLYVLGAIYFWLYADFDFIEGIFWLFVIIHRAYMILQKWSKRAGNN